MSKTERCPFNPFPSYSEWGKRLDWLWQHRTTKAQKANDDALEFSQALATGEWKSVNRRAALNNSFDKTGDTSDGK